MIGSAKELRILEEVAPPAPMKFDDYAGEFVLGEDVRVVL